MLHRQAFHLNYKMINAKPRRLCFEPYPVQILLTATQNAVKTFGINYDKTAMLNTFNESYQARSDCVVIINSSKYANHGRIRLDTTVFSFLGWLEAMKSNVALSSNVKPLPQKTNSPILLLLVLTQVKWLWATVTSIGFYYMKSMLSIHLISIIVFPREDFFNNRFWFVLNFNLISRDGNEQRDHIGSFNDTLNNSKRFSLQTLGTPFFFNFLKLIENLPEIRFLLSSTKLGFRSYNKRKILTVAGCKIGQSTSIVVFFCCGYSINNLCFQPWKHCTWPTFFFQKKTEKLHPSWRVHVVFVLW